MTVLLHPCTRVQRFSRSFLPGRTAARPRTTMDHELIEAARRAVADETERRHAEERHQQALQELNEATKKAKQSLQRLQAVLKNRVVRIDGHYVTTATTGELLVRPVVDVCEFETPRQETDQNKNDGGRKNHRNKNRTGDEPCQSN